MAKRILSILLLCALVLSLGAMPALAAEDPPEGTPTVTVGKVTWDSATAKTETVDIPVVLSNNPGLNNVSLAFTWDAEKIDLQSGGSLNYDLGSDWNVSGITNDPGRASLNWGGPIGVDVTVASSTFIVLHAKILKGWCGTTEIGVTVNDPSGDGEVIVGQDETGPDYTASTKCVPGSIGVNVDDEGKAVHHWGAWDPAEKPADLDCTDPWTQTRTCEWCGAVETKNNESGTHTPDESKSDMEAVEPKDCYTPGHYAYQFCSRCENYIIYVNGTDKTPILSKNQADTVWKMEHELSFVEQINAVCVTKEGETGATGVVAHYECENCGHWFSDAKAENEIPNDPTDPANVLPATHDVKWIAEVAPNCETGVAGTAAHWGCVNCGKAYKGEQGGEAGDEMTPTEKQALTIPATHKIEKVNAVEASCDPADTKNGNKEYYKCTVCEKIFEDAAGKKEITLDDVTIVPAHNIVYVARDPAVCGEGASGKPGTGEHYKCTICGTLFSDAKGETIITAAPVLEPTHDIQEVAEVKADCATGKPGVAKHYECVNCGKFYKDAAGTQEMSEEEIAALTTAPTHTFGAKVAEKPATCDPKLTDGVKEHYECSVCGQLAIDKTSESAADKVQGDYELVDEDALVIKAEHTLGALQAAVPVSCEPKKEADGMKAHYVCEVCGKYFNEDQVIVSAASLKTKWQHDYGALIAEVPFEEVVDGDNVTFTPGVEAHYVCARCGYVFQDEDGEKVSIGKNGDAATDEALKIEGDHSYTALTAVVEKSEDEDGTLHNGMGAYYRCTVCQKYFVDDNGKPGAATTRDALIDKAAHTVESHEKEEAKHSSTEFADGHEAYVQCTKCKQYFAVEADGVYDEDSTPVTLDSLKIEAKHDSPLTSVDEVAAEHSADGSFKPGVKAHYLCATCGKMFSDAEGKTEVSAKDLETNATHTYKFVEAEPADCEAEKDGVAEHYVCDVCGAVFTSDGEGANITYTEVDEDDLILPAEHKITAVEASDPTCYKDGQKAHYTCENCKKVFADEEGLIELTTDDVILPKLDHKNMVEVQERNSTYKQIGVIHHWYCPDCKSYFIEKADDATQPDLTNPLTEADVQKDPVTKLKGDVNGDGKVTARDLQLARKFFADREANQSKINEANTDVNDDSKLTARDLQILRKHFADPTAGYLD